MLESISDIKHAIYINLLNRTDRKSYIERELEKVGIKAERFNAIKLQNGALGCSMSHLKILQTAKQNGWDHVLIFEDDVQFLEPTLFVNQMNSFLKNHTTDWDVVLLAGNNMPPYNKIDETCVQVFHCQTTTSYLVKSHYFDTLINNYKEGIKKLISEPHKHIFFAIDKYWIQLQQIDKWYLIIPLTVVQKVDYSDIEKRMTNYKKVMTDLDKENFLKMMNQSRKV
jgi:glycosyl transferase family 25